LPSAQAPSTGPRFGVPAAGRVVVVVQDVRIPAAPWSPCPRPRSASTRPASCVRCPVSGVRCERPVSARAMSTRPVHCPVWTSGVRVGVRTLRVRGVRTVTCGTRRAVGSHPVSRARTWPPGRSHQRLDVCLRQRWAPEAAQVVLGPAATSSWTRPSSGRARAVGQLDLDRLAGQGQAGCAPGSPVSRGTASAPCTHLRHGLRQVLRAGLRASGRP
jgi:hypothetical protein